MKIELKLNERQVTWEINPGVSLLEALRDNNVFSVKMGCGTGDCGACTVLFNGEPVNSCVLPAGRVNGQAVTTIDGLLHDELMLSLQEALVENAAVQCGYCSPGMLISLYALIKEGHLPTEAEIRHALAGNLCRCTGYVKPVEAACAVVAALGAKS